MVWEVGLRLAGGSRTKNKVEETRMEDMKEDLIPLHEFEPSLAVVGPSKRGSVSWRSQKELKMG